MIHERDGAAVDLLGTRQKRAIGAKAQCIQECGAIDIDIDG
jgi:hypothetical protein